MSQLHRELSVRKAVAMTGLLVYLAIACCVNLFHSEGCPLANGKTAPSSDPCPACKFLAGANSAQVLPESSPATIEHQIVLIAAPNSPVINSRCWTSSIILRGPPSLTQV